MESIEDDLVLPIPEDPQSPIPKPKLKRLKKSSTSSSSAAAAIPDSIRVSESPIVPDRDSTSSADKERGFEDDLDPLFSVPSDEPAVQISDSPITESRDPDGVKNFEDDLDPLFSMPAADGGAETLDLERERESEEKDDGLKNSGGIVSGMEKKSVKKRLNLDEGSEEISKKKRKKRSKEPKESVREKRRTEKERMVQLEQIHAESQRLLRETRDASFKPVPLVQKPISSVLEKIRLRKLEVLKQTSILCQSDSVEASDCSVDEIVQKNSSNSSVRNQNDSRENAGDAEVDGISVRCRNNSGDDIRDAPMDDLPHAQVADSDRSPKDPCGGIPCNNEATFRSKYGDNNQLDDLEETSSPPLPASELKPIPDDLSSEEEDDKENIDPHKFSIAHTDSPPEHELAKAFLDDEAEEEDDSDHDLLRFQENEEDDESDADEVFDDLIATDYKEAPMDREKRNELHQKWLEQQDAVGTDDILQRLKYGKKQRDPTFLQDEDDYFDDDDDDNNDGDDDLDDSTYEKSDDPSAIDDARQNSRMAKQMMAQMFTDAHDSYVPSDEEDSEQTLFRQRILKQTGESSFISPVEDENSREFFGLIKKLNVAPITKKRGKTVTSNFDSLMMGANSNSSSKSSFLNRTTSNSLPSLHKQTSTTVRAFIFGRDDSNSRGSITASESVPDTHPKENHTSRASKFNSSSQSRSTAKTKTETSSSSASGSSLFQMLRQSSVQFDRHLNQSKASHQKITESQAAYQFSAFKLRKRATKVESRV
ncbi:uncharacterized protein DDB_G0283697 isoform X2 [Asparagus officinalis]|uniref:uncharacterized protein DDB_G0283697 isoform X2 n=1 Tax=Asparagus officinalis TaxID=4686 RepID=UPI00098E0183|nr:uncharacterized protein DDB_G0283697 isoform X2 [Asparagus officinalis]